MLDVPTLDTIKNYNQKAADSQEFKDTFQILGINPSLPYSL